MVNESGQVVGITTCKFTDAENMGFGIPAEHAQELLKAVQALAEDYSVCCPNCNHHLSKPIEFCDVCGSEVNINAYFAEAERDVIADFVEQSLLNMGINPVLTRSGQHFWTFYQGSALIRIFPYRDRFISLSPLATVSKTNPGNLYRFLLEFNQNPYFMYISDNIIYLALKLHLSEVYDASNQTALSEYISGLIKLADEMDNKLIHDFGCEPAPETNRFAL